LNAAVEDLAVPGQVKAIRGSTDVSDMLDNTPIERANQPHGKDLNTSGTCADSALASAVPARRRVIAKPISKRKQSPPSHPQATSTQPDLNTWQEHEITGHLMQDADDDGYGINGIGFRPTPAIAYERSQKRKMQLSAWKVRESSEARERRGERRRKLDDETSRPPSFTERSTDTGAADAGTHMEGEGGGNRDARMVRFA